VFHICTSIIGFSSTSFYKLLILQNEHLLFSKQAIIFVALVCVDSRRFRSRKSGPQQGRETEARSERGTGSVEE
jgi:hypothetical protein